MALYKHATFLGQSQHEVFDQVRHPGTATPYSGIYRCENCGREITSEAQNPLPPQSHHQHAPGQGEILWRLVVYADHKPK